MGSPPFQVYWQIMLPLACQDSLCGTVNFLSLWNGSFGIDLPEGDRHVAAKAFYHVQRADYTMDRPVRAC
jgi:hypothetical protein